METKILLDQLEQIEYDRHNMTLRSMTAIIEEIGSLAEPESIEQWERHTPYGRIKYAKLTFDTYPQKLTLTIKQSGGDGVYATYFEYKY